VNEETASLARLHDIVLPAPVPWWPPAPGWYGVGAVLALALLLLAHRAWRRWQGAAYRRAAQRTLAAAGDAAGIAEVLRRTALAIAPRAEVAALDGERWVRWLEDRCAVEMPEPVRTLLGRGVYAPAAPAADLDALRAWAAQWIARHGETSVSRARDPAPAPAGY